jgi:protein phosphatase
VRFEEIRELLRGSSDPLEVCKALTERANQAGGHDNITVIVVQFDGPGIKGADEGGEPLKYRKYVLADESLGDTAPMPAAQMQGGSGAPAPEARAADGSIRPLAPAGAAGGWQEPGHPGEYDPNAIEIPGTHVPVWMVVGIVVGVIILLAGTAFLLLR